MRRTTPVDEAINLFALCLLSRDIGSPFGHVDLMRKYNQWALRDRGYCISYEDGLPALRRITKAQADCAHAAS